MVTSSSLFACATLAKSGYPKTNEPRPADIRKCPYCRRPTFAEDAVPTPRWTTLTTQHNQHMPNEADEEIQF
ncbi:hypothetical protein niasHS_005661 [Heterodera schachtii]|uniref:Uncharacterized protein n=1 Tax=Heterodera schachtii TaxID=97005 RepID=A0ABD2JZ28_HETSC